MNATYQVEAGDTLSKIASKKGVTLKQLIDANPALSSGGKNLDLIHPGDAINIPSSSLSKEKKPDQPVQTCPLADLVCSLKKDRLEKRNKLIAESRKRAADPKVSAKERQALSAAADRLERDNKAVERARLSEAAYNPDGPPPDGWEKLSGEDLKKLGVTNEMLRDDKSGFKACVYRSGFEEPPAIVIAFAGTEPGPADAAADFRQAIGEPERQYDEAIALTQTIAINAKKNGEEVETAGHSLGGGLASAGSAMVGVKGTTINAAGLHDNTTSRLNLSSSTRSSNSNMVDAYYNTSDPVNYAQDNRESLVATIEQIRKAKEGLKSPPGERPSGILEGLKYDASEKLRKAALEKTIAGENALIENISSATGMAQNDVRTLINDPDKLKNAIPRAYGNRHPVSPAKKNEHSWTELVWADRNEKAKQMALDGHGADKFIEAMEEEKASDVKTMGGVP